MPDFKTVEEALEHNRQLREKEQEKLRAQQEIEAQKQRKREIENEARRIEEEELIKRIDRDDPARKQFDAVCRSLDVPLGLDNQPSPLAKSILAHIAQTGNTSPELVWMDKMNGVSCKFNVGWVSSAPYAEYDVINQFSRRSSEYFYTIQNPPFEGYTVRVRTPLVRNAIFGCVAIVMEPPGWGLLRWTRWLM